MKLQRFPAFLVATLGFLAPWSDPCAQAQAAQAGAQTLPEARTVIDRFVEVTHVKPVLEKSSSIHTKGTVELSSMGLKGTVETWNAKPAQHLVMMDMAAAGKIVSGCDGKTAWMTMPMMGARLLKDSELMQARLESSFFNLLKPAELYESMKTVGRENFEGKDCYKLELVAKPLDGMDAAKTREARTVYEFYEVESGLLAGSKGRQESEMGGGPYTQVASDYKDFGGQLVATKNLVRQSGQEFVITITSLEYDTAGADTFTPPKDVQGLLNPPAPAKAQ